jgi:rubrerythrin
MMDLKEALETALDMEKKGYEIYMGTAEKTQNPHVKKTFSYLAGEEINHIREIEEYIEKDKPGIELKGDTPEDVEKFFNTTIREFREKTELAEDDVKAYETALELEEKGYNFYKEQFEEAEDEQAKNFFRFLMEQENAHYELFQKDLEYLKDPAGFFGEEEQHFFEGG